MENVMLVIGIIIGCFIGFTIKALSEKHATCGTLEIDMTNSLPYTRLLTTCQIEEITKHKTVSFSVNPNATFTHEKQSL